MTSCVFKGRQAQEENMGKDEIDDSCVLDTTVRLLRIVTWSSAAPTLQAYVDSYHKAYPNLATIQLEVLPSIQEAGREAIVDAKFKTGLYDGFVLPPMFLGGLFEQEGLAEVGDVVDGEDLLPYYKKLVATFDNRTFAVPLFAGSQLLVLYRKDLLSSQSLEPPKTWKEFSDVASKMQNLGPLGPDFPLCLGRLSEEGCRQRFDETTVTCQSLSMSYLGMTLATMTQGLGNSTGWWLNDNAEGGLMPLLESSLESTLIFLEEQSNYGGPNDFNESSAWNIDGFRKGRCAMTITADHPPDLLSNPKVGFVPLPGSDEILNRKNFTLDNCTELTCPFGAYSMERGRIINLVPFGATDEVVGGVSSLVSAERQALIKDFLQYILSNPLSNATFYRQQPFTHKQLVASSVQSYAETIANITSNENGAIPFRIPLALDMWIDLDNRVYNYLQARNFSQVNRETLRISVEESWQRIIEIHDYGYRTPAVPLAIFYEKSLNVFMPESSDNLYIGQALRAGGWFLALLSMLFSCGLAIWVYCYQKEPVIRASQPIFLYMICAGTFVMATAIFPYGVEDDIVPQEGANVACTAGTWMYSLGIITTFTALFSKTWKITRVRAF